MGLPIQTQIKPYFSTHLNTVKLALGGGGTPGAEEGMLTHFPSEAKVQP